MHSETPFVPLLTNILIGNIRIAPRVFDYIGKYPECGLKLLSLFKTGINISIPLGGVNALFQGLRAVSNCALLALRTRSRKDIFLALFFFILNFSFVFPKVFQILTYNTHLG